MNPRVLASSLMIASSLLFGGFAWAQPTPPELENVDIVERLGEYVDLDLAFVDHEGNDVTLRDYVRGDVPVILTLNYYSCPMLCTLQLNGLIDGLKRMPWAPGDNYRIVTLSINPEEGPTLAAAKRSTYLSDLGRGSDVDWTFLTGDQAEISALADQVGFQYQFVPETGEYAHGAALFMLAPDGKIARYLYGITYSPSDLRFGIVEAGEGRVGSVVDRFILRCFHYDPDRNSYVPYAFGIMRLGGLLTVLLLGGLLGILWLRDMRRKMATA